MLARRSASVVDGHHAFQPRASPSQAPSRAPASNRSRARSPLRHLRRLNADAPRPRVADDRPAFRRSARPTQVCSLDGRARDHSRSALAVDLTGSHRPRAARRASRPGGDVAQRAAWDQGGTARGGPPRPLCGPRRCAATFAVGGLPRRSADRAMPGRAPARRGAGRAGPDVGGRMSVPTMPGSLLRPVAGRPAFPDPCPPCRAGRSRDEGLGRRGCRPVTAPRPAPLPAARGDGGAIRLDRPVSSRGVDTPPACTDDGRGAA